MWRFRVSNQPQRGHCCCLSEKAADPVLQGCAQTECLKIASGLAALNQLPTSSPFFDGTPDGATRFIRIEKGRGTALTALRPHSRRNLTMTVRPEHGTFYDGTAALNN